jgi:hypothetical protein
MKGILSRKRRKIKLIKEKTNKDQINQKIEKVSRIICPSVIYKKIKYKNELYSINDCLLIRDPLVKDGYLIAKLLQIIPNNGIEKYPYWPAIQVQWYLILIKVLH